MVTKVFALFDSKAQAYCMPFYAPAVGLAVRNVADAAKDPQCTFGKHPEDFTLYQIGEFDDSLGLLVGMEPKVNLGLVSQLMDPLAGLPLGERKAEVVK